MEMLTAERAVACSTAGDNHDLVLVSEKEMERMYECTTARGIPCFFDPMGRYWPICSDAWSVCVWFGGPYIAPAGES